MEACAGFLSQSDKAPYCTVPSQGWSSRDRGREKSSSSYSGMAREEIEEEE